MPKRSVAGLWLHKTFALESFGEFLSSCALIMSLIDQQCRLLNVSAQPCRTRSRPKFFGREYFGKAKFSGCDTRGELRSCARPHGGLPTPAPAGYLTAREAGIARAPPPRTWRVHRSPVQRRLVLAGRLERPAPDLRILVRLRALEGQKTSSRGDILVTREKWDRLSYS